MRRTFLDDPRILGQKGGDKESRILGARNTRHKYCDRFELSLIRIAQTRTNATASKVMFFSSALSKELWLALFKPTYM